MAGSLLLEARFCEPKVSTSSVRASMYPMSTTHLSPSFLVVEEATASHPSARPLRFLPSMLSTCVVRWLMYDMSTWYLPSSPVLARPVVPKGAAVSLATDPRRASNRSGSAVRASMYDISTLHFLSTSLLGELPFGALAAAVASAAGGSAGSAAFSGDVASCVEAPGDVGASSGAGAGGSALSSSAGAAASSSAATAGAASGAAAASTAAPSETTEMMTLSCWPKSNNSPSNLIKPFFLAAFSVPSRASKVCVTWSSRARSPKETSVPPPEMRSISLHMRAASSAMAAATSSAILPSDGAQVACSHGGTRGVRGGGGPPKAGAVA
mmetsp:Transcript_177118/g.568020  ORF Transcript_177118/g.568020 Transcript_177118/m.568020 type:complete len:325 (-) Transcript_177118:8-982(-)